MSSRWPAVARGWDRITGQAARSASQEESNDPKSGMGPSRLSGGLLGSRRKTPGGSLAGTHPQATQATRSHHPLLLNLMRFRPAYPTREQADNAGYHHLAPHQSPDTPPGPRLLLCSPGMVTSPHGLSQAGEDSGSYRDSGPSLRRELFERGECTCPRRASGRMNPSPRSR